MNNSVFDGSYKLHPKDFFFKVLSGSAQGILIAVLPSAVLKYILMPLIGSGVQWAIDLNAILVLFSSFLPILVGIGVAMQFKMRALDVGVMAIAVGASSGSIKWAVADSGFVNPITGVATKTQSTVYMMQGAGDVINAMIVSAIAVLVIWAVAKYLNGFGAVAIILSPLLIGGGIGLLGFYLAPYVGTITAAIGDVVRLFTDLQPLPMSMLIAIAFAFLIMTPVSTVGTALAITLAGIGAGAAGVGVVASTVILLINSVKVNKTGTSVAIFLGAMKGMMPSVFKKPVIFLSMFVTAALSAIPVALFNVQGTPTSAGFGWIGMVSPIQSMLVKGSESVFVNHVIGVIPALITWFIVPIAVGFVVDYVATKILHLYSPEDLQQEIN